jgi:hypothetical protein
MFAMVAVLLRYRLSWLWPKHTFTLTADVRVEFL